MPDNSQPIELQPNGLPGTMPPPGQGPFGEPAPGRDPNLEANSPFGGEGLVMPIRPGSEPDLRSTLRLRTIPSPSPADGVETEGEGVARRLPALEPQEN
jgi:hypothetical protein